MTMHLGGQELPIYPPAPLDPQLQPADALLRESTTGQSRYSPQTQFEEIAKAMARNGHYPACIDGDERRGHVSARRGYQNIRSRVEAGLTTAVYVIHSARLGRDASERMKLARELRKLKVPIYSCQQGVLKDDLAGGVYALMDQQFSVDLAAKIVLAMPKAVKAGLYPARTPVGYKRIWPQKDGEEAQYERKARPDMVEDEHYADLVRTIFRRYGIEGWSMRAIVRWLNSPETLATHPNPEGETGQWNRPTISRMLRKRVYLGEVEWGKTKDGYYDRYDGPVLRSGEGDCGPARHAPLIERAVWEAVQMRLSADEKRLQTHTRTGRTPCLLTGFLVCAGCGQPMRGSRERPARRATGAYICAQQDSCLGGCREPRIAMSVAHPAVLREVARLRPTQPYAPLGSGALRELAAHDRHAAQRADLQAAIASAQREHAHNIKVLKLIDDPDEGTIATFRRDNRALHDQITALEAQLAALPRSTVDPERMQEALRRLAQSDVAGKIARAEADGDTAALRELLGWTVQRAQIVER
ncbi:MAG TPA: recombinase family protein, partial [Chloroflexota bacterium]|nr:recombinase family protein [Chloroflexota bacterium]